MRKKILFVLILAGLFMCINTSIVYAKGPPAALGPLGPAVGTQGYNSYCEHAGNGTHAGDPLNIDPDNSGGGPGGAY